MTDISICDILIQFNSINQSIILFKV